MCDSFAPHHLVIVLCITPRQYVLRKLPARSALTDDDWKDLVDFAVLLPDDYTVLTSLFSRLGNGSSNINAKHLEFLFHLDKLLPALAQLQTFLIANPSRSQQTASPDIVKPIIALRRCNAEVKAFIERGNANVMSEGEETHCVLFGTVKLDIVALSSLAETLMTQLAHQWGKDLAELSSAMHAWIPAGWEAVKDTILQHPEVICFLLPTFPIHSREPTSWPTELSLRPCPRPARCMTCVYNMHAMYRTRR